MPPRPWAPTLPPDGGSSGARITRPSGALSTAPPGAGQSPTCLAAAPRAEDHKPQEPRKQHLPGDPAAALLALAQQFRSEVTSSVSQLANLFLVQAAQQRRAAPPAALGLPLTARFHPSRSDSDVWFLVSLAPGGQFPFCFLPRKTPTPMWF